MLVLAAGLLVSGCRAPSIALSLPDPEHIDAYGGLRFDVSSGDFLARGADLADLAELEIVGRSVVLPVVPSFRHVRAGTPALVVAADPVRPLCATISHGEAATRWGIAERKPGTRSVWRPAPGVAFPVPARVRIVRKGGFAAAAAFPALRHSTRREDYPELDDAAYANFRAVTAPRIASNRLYRSSSPLDPSLGRAGFADSAARAAGIRTIVNMTDHAETAAAYPGAAGRYALSCNTLYVPMGVDFTLPSFMDGLRDGIRFFATYGPPCLFHCKEGQDRTGFACAVIELLCGATLDEARQDYLLSFRNTCQVEEASPLAASLAQDFDDNLRAAFGLDDLPSADLAQAARDYLLRTGLEEREIDDFLQCVGPDSPPENRP